MIQPEIVELKSSDSEMEDEVLSINEKIEEVINLESEDYNKHCRKKSVVKRLANSHIKYLPNFMKFVELCLRLHDNNDMRDILKVLLIPSYELADEKYINSPHFNGILLNSIKSMEKSTNISYVGIKKVVMNLKANRKDKIITYDLCDEDTNIETVNNDIDLDTTVNKSKENDHQIELNNDNGYVDTFNLDTNWNESENLTKRLKRLSSEMEINNINSNVNNVEDSDIEISNSKHLRKNKKSKKLEEIELNNSNNFNINNVIYLDNELNHSEYLRKNKKKTKRNKKKESNNSYNSNINDNVDTAIEFNESEDNLRKKKKTTVNNIIDLDSELIHNENLTNKKNKLRYNEIKIYNTINAYKAVDLDIEFNNTEYLKKTEKTVHQEDNATNATKLDDILSDKVLNNLNSNIYNNEFDVPENEIKTKIDNISNNEQNITNTDEDINTNLLCALPTPLEMIRQSQIAAIESEIKECKDQIQLWEETVVNFEADAKSPYILCDRFKVRLLRLYKKLCKLTNNVSYKDKKRPVISLKVPEDHPTGPARQLEAWFNRPLKKNETLFPDFMDVVKCVTDANQEDSLGWTPAKILTEARSLFKQCGKQLQKRRQKREWRHLKRMLGDNQDPADLDPELKAKLQRNKAVADKRENEVVEFYCNAENQYNERVRRVKLKKISDKNINNDTSTTPTQINNCEAYTENFSKLEVENYKLQKDVNESVNFSEIAEDNNKQLINEQEIIIYPSEIEEENDIQHNKDDTLEEGNDIENDDDAYTDESEDSDIELIEESFVFIKDENDTLQIKKESEITDEETIVKEEEINTEIKSEDLSENDVLSILIDIEKKSVNGLNIETQIIYEEPTVTVIFDSSDDSDVECML